MDAGQYKDYVLFMLFIKYVTDKYGDSTDFAPPLTIPTGASFKDMLSAARATSATRSTRKSSPTPASQCPADPQRLSRLQ